MRRSEFIRKWLGNKEKSYTEQFRDEMFEDLDAVIATAVKNLHLHDVNGSFYTDEQIEELKNHWWQEGMNHGGS